MCLVLPQDILSQNRAERTLIQRGTPIGIVADDYPSWFWQVGTLGKVQWMRSGQDLPGRQENDPPWFSTENQLGTLGDIEVLFVQDAWPAGEDSIWAMTCLKVAVRITHWKSRRRKRQKLSFPARWESCYQYDVSHNDVGGVTDGGSLCKD